MAIAVSPLINNNKKIKTFLLSAGSTGFVGELLHDKDMTGHPSADLLIKVILPLISGVIAPMIKEWIDTRKEKRNLRKKQKTNKNVK